MSNCKIKTPHSSANRKGYVRLHILPAFVWLCALVGVIFLFKTRIQRFEVIGMAQSKTWQISAVETGRIKTMPVKLFGKVKKGQVVAVLDSKLINARLNTIKAQVARLHSELIANRQTLEVDASNQLIDIATEHRRFSADVEDARLEVLKHKAVLEPDRILLKDYQAEIDIEMELLVTGATFSTYNIEKAKALYDNLALKVEKNELLLIHAEIIVDEAIKRKIEFFGNQPASPSADIALDAIRKAIDVQQQMMEEVIVEGNSLIIKSPADGVVSCVFAKAGEVAAAEVPFITIVETDAVEVIAYASDTTHNALKPGQRVQLVKNGLTPQIAETQVVKIGPSIDLVPPRLMTNPDMPQWGRPFLVKVPLEMKLVPGEKVGIRRLHDKR